MSRVIIAATPNRTMRCPRCGATPGLGMALTEPVPCTKPDLLLALATCQCGQTSRVYWRSVRPTQARHAAPIGGGRGA